MNQYNKQGQRHGLCEGHYSHGKLWFKENYVNIRLKDNLKRLRGVYFTPVESVTYVGAKKDSKKLFHAFSKIYSKLKEDALSGSDFSLPKLKNDEETLTPLNSTLLEKLRKKHNI